MRSFDFSPFFRSTVGFYHQFDLLDQVSDNSQSYPPYNIERTGENAYRITLAVAGFAEKDLGIEVSDGVLTVAGKREDAQKPGYLHHGIAGRAFERRFQLAEHVEVKTARSSRTGSFTSTWSVSFPKRSSRAGLRSTRRN